MSHSDPNLSNPYQYREENAEAIPHDQIDFVDGNRRGNPIFVAVAWLVILLVSALIYTVNFTSNANDAEQTNDKIELQQTNLLAKTSVAQAHWDNPMSVNLESMNTGAYEQRLCYVLVKSELRGPMDARKSLDKLREKVVELDYSLSDHQTRLDGLVEKLLADYAAGDWQANSLSQDDRKFLKDNLGYSAEIGLAPSDGKFGDQRELLIAEAKRSSQNMIAFMILLLGGGCLGFVCFSILMILLMGNLIPIYAMGHKQGFFPFFRRHFESNTRNGRIYVETFAVWMCCFIGSGLVIGLAVGLAGIEVNGTQAAGIGLISFFGSLVALMWPRIRGISYAELFRDIGWTMQNPFKEVALGVFGYLANLPILGVGIFLVVMLTFASQSLQDRHELDGTPQASHPIVEQIASGDTLIILLVVVTACVAAPIVEETVFRGLLYRHLREVSRKWALGLSVLFAVVVNSFIFAAIHPQGWTAIPVLMALAIGFSWVREWRGSLIAPITMHAVNNGVISLVMLLMM